MSLKKALLAATVLSLPVAAQAQAPISGLYIAGGVGANYRVPSDTGLTISNNTVNAAVRGNYDVKTEWGYTALGSIGWGFGNGLRVELEGNYRNNSIRNIVGTYGNGGTIHQYGAMANALYDFNLGLNPAGVSVTPYLGVGVGYVFSDWRNVGGRVNNSLRLRTDDRDGQFAYQGIAGLAFGLDAVVPGLALTTEYRFMGTLEPELNTVALANNGAPLGAGNYKPTNYNHSVLVGLRYAFNAPRPAPVVAAPAPAPAPARTFL
uniref:outer membrane protein n=1 Tax=Roseococcus sp. YIM B11640 TaxID=3133973 RepID=UPI003C7D7A5F